MEGVTLKARAVAFAFYVGAVAFILSFLALVNAVPDDQAIVRAVVIAIICATMSWAAAERALAGIAEAIDAVVARVVQASEGDLSTPTSETIESALPLLSGALNAMFDQVRANLENAHSLALFDPVTSLANRTHFRTEVERVLKVPSATGVGALAFIDLDHFKAVNDTLGHAHGDQLLAKVANRLRMIAAAETVRQNGAGCDPVVGRLAGDEFTVFFPNLTGRDEAAQLGSAMLDALVRPFDLGQDKVTVGASIGLAMYPEHGTVLTGLMRSADVAMYHAKASGRGQVQFYAASLAERMARRTRLETELRGALDRDEFTMVFQPQVSLPDGQVQAVEGLLRWNHPSEGLRLPSSFLTCAEESGLIFEIGDWAVEALAKRVADWPHLGFAPRIAANLSPRQIMRPEFFARMRGSLARHNAPLSLIEFEVGEAVLMECGPTVLDQIARLRRDGATIAIDDFGSGSSSLARLRSLPFDRVKLDPSLIAGIDRDPAAREIVQAVIGLVRSLGAKTVAEGVENRAQLDVLRVMGCDAIQGYAIAPPMTEAQYRSWQSGPALAELLAA